MAVLLNTGANMKVYGLENPVLTGEHMTLRGHCIPGYQKRGQGSPRACEQIRPSKPQHKTRGYAQGGSGCGAKVTQQGLRERLTQKQVLWRPGKGAGLSEEELGPQQVPRTLLTLSAWLLSQCLLSSGQQ